MLNFQGDAGSVIGEAKFINAPGKYHFLVIGPKDEAGQLTIETTNKEGQPQVAVEVQCLASSDPSQVGRTMREWFSVVGKTAESTGRLRARLGALAAAVGLVEKRSGQLVTQDAWNQWMKSGANVAVDFNELFGRQFCVEVKQDGEREAQQDDGTTKKFPNFRFEWNIYSPLSPTVKTWPKSAQHLALLNGGVASATVTPAQPQQAPQGQPAAQADYSKYL
jgi:hypothetical protein